MRILVTGASGAVGSQLIPRLVSDGHEVRALVRRTPEDPRVVASLIDAERSCGDAVTGEGLAAALSDVEVAYYLIHSMQRPQPAAAAVDVF